MTPNPTLEAVWEGLGNFLDVMELGMWAAALAVVALCLVRRASARRDEQPAALAEADEEAAEDGAA